MADKRLRSIKWPELPDRYFVKDYDADIAQIFEDVYNLYPRKSLPSAPIHSFADGADNIPVKAMDVDVRVVQDLHGQSSPYPANGGKNKFPQATVSLGTPNGRTETIYFDTPLPAGDYVMSFVKSGTATGVWGCGFYSSSNVQIGSVNTNTGAISLSEDAVRAYFYMNQTDFDNNLTVIFSNVQVESGSTATAYAPYSNICPIAGWTQAQIVGSGVNVWDEEWELGIYDPDTGEKSENLTAIRSKNAIPVKPSTTYYLHNGGSGNWRVFWYSKDGTYLSYEALTTGNTAITVPSNAYYLRFYMQAAYGTTYNHDISINYPSTDTSYHAYNGRIVTIDFGSTVYGGTLTYRGGKEWEFTPTHAIVDLGTLTWGIVSGNFKAYVDGMLIATASGLDSDLMCSQYRNWLTAYNTPQTAQDGDIWRYVGAAQILVKDSRYTDAASFAAAMSGVQLVYPLATPITILLTADSEVVTEYGDNVLYADCGNSELTYRQDIGLLLGGE